MTHAGTITVGVDIDASDIRAELTNAIREAVLPAIAEMNRELNSVSRSYAEVGRSSQRSAAVQVASLNRVINKLKEVGRATTESVVKQVAANKGLEDAIERVGREQEKTAARTAGSAALSTRSINAVTRALDRQTLAWSRLAAAQTAAAAAPQPNAPPRAGPGGGGGGGRRGGGAFGDLFTGQGGGSRFLTSPVGLNVLALGASALPAATTAVVNLAGAVQQLGQAGLAVPGIFAGIAASAGTAVFGLKGVGDAVKALNDAAGDPKKIKDVEKALKDLSPAAIEVAKSVSAFTQGLLKDLQKTVSQTMLDGVAREFDDFTAKVLPRAEKGLTGISRAWNATIKELFRVAGSDSTGGFFDRIFGNTAEAQTRANKAIEPFVHAFGALTATGSDFLPRLADGLGRLATRFDDFITKADKTGDLAKWIDEGFRAAGNLGESLLNVGKIITDITKAAGGDGGFLQWLRDATGRLHDFLSSTEGQNTLKQFFTEGRESLGQWMDTIKSLLPIIGQVVQGFHDWGTVLLPIIKSIADALNGLGGGSGVIAGIVTAFLAWKTIGGIIGGITNALGGLSGALGSKGGGGVLGKLSALKTIGGIGALGIGGDLLSDPNASDLAKFGGAAANIGGGALLGANFGPWGAAIGALIGAGVSLFEVGRAQLEKGKAEWAKAWEENTNDPAAQARRDATNAATGKGPEFFNPSLGTPSIPASLIPKIRAGQLPGFTVGPDGQIINTATGMPVTGLPPGLTTPPPAPPPTPPPSPRPPATGWQAGAPEVNIDTQQIEKTKTALNEIKTQVAQGFNGAITLTDPTPEIVERLRQLGIKITSLPNGKFTVDPIGLDAAVSKAANLNAQLGAFAGKTFTAKVAVSGQVSVPAVNVGGNAGSPHRSTGGVFPGYQPGVDSIWAKYSPGEGVLIPEATRALGGGPGIYAINSFFRPGLSRRHYADGGVTPGGLPAVFGGDPVIGLLTQIRDLLAGKVDGAVSATADATGTLADASTTGGVGTTATGAATGPRDVGREMAAAAISALGGDPAKFLPPVATTAVGTTAAGGGVAAALKAFAASGSTDALAGTGLGINDPVITALTSARAKKKNGLTDDQIGGLVDQVLTGGGFSGTLDESNTALVKALTRFRDKGGRGTALPGAVAPTALDGTTAGVDTSGMATAAVGGVQSVFVTNWPGQPMTGLDGQPVHGGTGAAAGPGGATNFLGKPILDAAGQAVGQAASDVAGDAVSAAFGQATDFKIGTPTSPDSDLARLIHERNGPGALASAFGFDVPDYTRRGGEGAAGDPNAPSFDAKGRMFSDTGTLIDRTMTDLQAAMKAQFDQQMAVLNQIKNQLGEKVVKPITQAAVTAGIEDLSSRITDSIGQSMGSTAAPIIADAVRSAVASVAQSAAASGGDSGGGGLGGGSLAIPIPKLFDEGGIMPHASTGINLSGHPERVLDPRQTRLFDAGLLGGWNVQPQQQHAATVGGVIGNDTVGADFFGVSQIPIIGTIVNMLVRILLKMIGVEIEVRDTLDEMSSDVRQFRGDFKKFDASGRLINDTSALLDRSSTSEQAAADERIRILKIVIEALVKFIIEKIIVPIGKAVANAAIQAGASAAGAAINSQAPGAGGIVSSLISSAGMAGVDIGADLFSTFMSSLTPVLIDVVSQGLQSFFPDLVNSIFGGGLLSMLTAPIEAIIDVFTQGLGGGLGGIFGGLLGGLAFDSGGVANGTGLMPKATIAPERVLSPNQTALFERMVTALEGGATMRGGDTHIHAPFTVAGSAEGAKQAHNRLLELLG